MIHSEEHNYLFLQIAHTGCTALGLELLENYGGAKVLRKHARLHEAKEAGLLEGKRPIICAGIRNPLDAWVTRYMRMKNNHKGAFTNANKLKKNGGHLKPFQVRMFKFIQETDASFSEFVRKFPKSLYVAQKHLDETDVFIRFEHMQPDFKACVEKIGMPYVRPIPLVNPTKKKEPFWTYYDQEAWAIARETGGELMARLGYAFPDRPEDYAEIDAASEVERLRA